METNRESVRWGPLLCSYLSLFILGLLDNERGPVYPSILADFHVNQAVGSWFFSAASASQLITTWMGHWWLPRWGSFRGLRIFLCVQASGYGLMALSDRCGDRAWLVLILGSILFGISLGGMAIVQSTLVAESAPAHLQRRAFSGLHGMYGSASLVAPLATVGLMRWGCSWSLCFALSSVAPIVLLAGTWMSAPPRLRLRPQGQLRAHVPWRHSWVAVLMGLYVASEVAISSRLVLYVESELGRSPGEGASLLALFFAGLLAGRLLFTFAHIAISTRRLLIGSAVASLVTFTLGLTISPVFLGLSGLTMSVFFPMTMALVSEEFPQDIDGLTTLIMMMTAFGLVAMHASVGLLADHFGLGRALAVGPACLIIMIIILKTRDKVSRPMPFSEGKRL